MSVQRSRIAVSASAIILLAGCASTQLNHNTLELASTVGNLQTSQVLANLAMFLDNPAALPAHVDLSSGTASTTYSVNPAVTTPLSALSSSLNQITRTISGSPSIAAETQSTGSVAAASLTTTASDAWSQSWAYEPIIDGDELRRLRALYAYALGNIGDSKFMDEYPLVRKSQALSYATVKANGRLNPYCPDLGLKSSQTSTKTETVTDLSSKKATTTTTTVNRALPSDCDKVAIQIQIPDDQFLHEPSCIICMEGKYHGKYDVYSGPDTKLAINYKLRESLHGGWLLNESSSDLSDAIMLGRFGHHTLYIRPEDQWKLSEFTLFVLTATAQSTVGTAAAAAGSQPAQKKQATPGPAAPAPVPTLNLTPQQTVSPPTP